LKNEAPEGRAENFGNAIYIANHQNNYDMVTASNIVQPPTVTVGKKPAVDPVFSAVLAYR
jgi:1-acyl-sn-glycerol-3-phosphate acyltransferase